MAPGPFSRRARDANPAASVAFYPPQTLGVGTAMVMVKDPICGMSVDSDRAPAKGVYGGKAVYFCSGGCQKKYELAHKPA